MANTLLTPDQITKESQRILHQKLKFIGSVNRQYDSSFANEGAKIGDSLRVRLPNEYTVRTGATLSTQDTTEQSTTLQVATQKGVDLNFTSAELTTDLDSFSSRIIEPAMAVLAASMENDAISMYKDVYNQESNIGSSTTLTNILNARKLLVDGLTPMDRNVAMLMNTQTNVDLVDSMKGLFNDQSELSKQYREGLVGTGHGFKFFETTHLGNHITGTAAATTGYLVNGASQTGATLTVDTGTTTLVKGDIFTIAGVNRVHPETKVSTGVLQQFVVTSDSGTSATSLAISPSIVVTGGSQNVSGSPADNAAITKVGGASAAYGVNLGFHRDAFAFATADLILPKGCDMASRQVYDGVSLRLVRDYDISNDKLPARLDVLYGYKTIRPQLAARVAAN